MNSVYKPLKGKMTKKMARKCMAELVRLGLAEGNGKGCFRLSPELLALGKDPDGEAKLASLLAQPNKTVQ